MLSPKNENDKEWSTIKNVVKRSDKVSDKISFYGKFYEFLNSLESIPKDCENPFYNVNGKIHKYASISAINKGIKTKLKEIGLLCYQDVENGAIFTVLVDKETGYEKKIAPIKIQQIHRVDKTTGIQTTFEDPQAQGSGITYARRYSKQVAFDLDVEDDDGNLASGKKEYKKDFANKQKETLDESKNEEVYVFKSGKHVDKKITDVPVEFLNWLSEQKGSLAIKAKTEINRREAEKTSEHELLSKNVVPS